MISQEQARRKQKEGVKRCARFSREKYSEMVGWRSSFFGAQIRYYKSCVVRKERTDSAKEMFSLVQDVVVEEMTQRNAKVEFSAEAWTPDQVSTFPQISLSGQRSIPGYSSNVHQREYPPLRPLHARHRTSLNDPKDCHHPLRLPNNLGFLSTLSKV